jgi:WD40 repeat protein
MILASGSRDTTVKLWGGQDGAALGTLAGNEYGVRAVAFSPDNNTLASSSYDGTVRFWNRSGKALLTLGPFTTSFLTLNFMFSPHGETLAVARGGIVKIWNAKSDEELHTLVGHSAVIKAITFSPDGQILASASMDKRINLWDTRSGRLLRTLQGHSDGVCSAVFSPNGEILASASHDRTIKLWDIRSGQELRSLEAFSRFSRAKAAFESVGFLAAVATSLEPKFHHRGRIELVFSPSGMTLASASHEKTIRLWDIGSDAHATLDGHSESVTAIVFSPDGKTLASASADKTVRLWA